MTWLSRLPNHNRTTVIMDGIDRKRLSTSKNGQMVGILRLQFVPTTRLGNGHGDYLIRLYEVMCSYTLPICGHTYFASLVCRHTLWDLSKHFPLHKHTIHGNWTCHIHTCRTTNIKSLHIDITYQWIQDILIWMTFPPYIRSRFANNGHFHFIRSRAEDLILGVPPLVHTYAGGMSRCRWMTQIVP